MADKVYLDDNGNPVKSAKVYLDDNGEPVGAKPAAPAAVPAFSLSELAGGAKEGLGAVYNMVRHPLDTASDIGTLVQGSAHLVDQLADKTTRQEALTGLFKGGGESVVGTTLEEAKRSPSRAVGQVIGGVLIPGKVIKSGVKYAKLARAGKSSMGAAEAAAAAAPKPILRPKPTALTIEQVMADAIADIRKPPQSVTLPPGLMQQPVTFPDVPRAKPTLKRAVKAEPAPPAATGTGTPTSAARVPTQPVGQMRMNVRVPEPTPAKPAPRAAKPTPELPESWKPLMKAQEPAPAPAGGAIDNVIGIANDAPMWAAPEAGVGLGEGRRAISMEKLGRGLDLDTIASEAGTSRDVLMQMLRDETGPTRHPTHTEFTGRTGSQRPRGEGGAGAIEGMDDSYLRRISDERGAVPPKAAISMGAAAGGGLIGAEMTEDTNPVAGGLIGALAGLSATNLPQALKALQVARVTGMLSGAAVPKSMAGNAGSFLTAAAENRSLAPLKEAARLPTNLKNLAEGWQTHANPAGIGGMGRFNVFGRAMGAMDEATTKALMRAGLSLEEAQRLLLTAPEALVGRGLQTRMQGPWGRMMFPFQRTPFNTVGEGLASLDDLLPNSGASAVKRGLTYGAGGAGLAAGDQTDNPLALALMAAFFGPRALPFAIGAYGTAGPQAAERIGVGLPEGSIRDLWDPTRPLDKPALLKLLESGGR